MRGKLHNYNDIFNFNFTYLWAIPFLLLIILYLAAVYQTNKKYRKWPVYRTVSYISGVISIIISIIGPIAELSHNHFVFHMYTHILLGMLGPLLLVISAPMTLLLRSISVGNARKVSKFLKSKYIQLVSHPILAALINLGGLWLLYTTNLFEAMHESIILSVLVHLHIFFAGYVFTTSIIYMDPIPHRTSFKLRSVVLILYMAGHSILSKWIYANPPNGITIVEAEIGGMTMYYGGDIVDVMIVIVLCYQFYTSSKARNTLRYDKYRFN